MIASTGIDSGIGAVNPLLYRGYYYNLEYYILMIADFLNIYTERQLRIKQEDYSSGEYRGKKRNKK